MPLFRHIMEMPARLEDLHKARHFVRECCKRDTCRQLTEENLLKLELAVHEATANIIRHAYQNRSDRRIIIEIQILENQIMVHLNHWGTPFIPTSVPLPILDGTAENGFGLYLMAQCVDSVDYECTPTGKNIIALLKRKTRRSTPKEHRARFVKETEGDLSEF